jgi:hypothetical protein
VPANATIAYWDRVTDLGRPSSEFPHAGRYSVRGRRSRGAGWVMMLRPGDPEAPARGKVERSEIFDVAGGDVVGRVGVEAQVAVVGVAEASFELGPLGHPRSTCAGRYQTTSRRPPADSDPRAPSSDTRAFRIRFRSSSRAKCIDDPTPGRWSRCRDMTAIRRMAQGGITGQRIVPARATATMPS